MERIPTTESTTESIKTEWDSILAQLSFHRKGAKSAEGLDFSLAVERNGTGKGAESRKESAFAFSLPAGRQVRLRGEAGFEGSPCRSKS
jgi:hypothetical protein